MDEVIRLEALDGVVELAGAERSRGVWPEGLQCTANEKGPDTARFTVRRDPGVPAPDLLAFTPVEIEKHGLVAWEGFVWDTPGGDEHSIDVECRGWQYHGDDDTFQRVWVHSKMSEWRDQRSFLGSDLAVYPAGSQVEVGDGGIVLAWPANVSAPALRAGVTLDLGPTAVGAMRVYVEYECTTGDANGLLRINGTDTESEASMATDAAEKALSAGSPSTHSKTFSAPRRYVHLSYRRTSAFTFGSDVYVRIKAVRVFTDAAYESGGQSVLTSSDVIKDALPYCPLWSQDTSGIDTVSFAHPHMAMTDERTPNSVFDVANSVHNYLFKLAPGRRVRFKPQPTVPLLKVGAWGGDAFRPASKSAGEDIFNRAVISAIGPDGSPVKVQRYAGQQPGVAFEEVATPSAPNPSFASNATNWTAFGGAAVARSTSSFDSTPASGLVTGGVGESGVETTFTGTFEAGITYALGLAWMSVPSFGSSAGFEHMRFGVADDYVSLLGPVGPLTGGVWYPVTMLWLPRKTVSGVKLTFFTWGTSMGIDSLRVLVGRPTLVDRRGFRRTRSVSSNQAATTPIAQQIADATLQAAMRTPLKGSLPITGRGDVRRFLTDESVDPFELLLYTGEVVHVADEIDPDTGALGRDGKVANVSYSSEEESAQVTIDSARDNLAAVLERYAVVAGS